MEKLANFRDLGGLVTLDGRTVKKGRILRSGQLRKASDADIAELESLGLKAVIDLRTHEETVNKPDRVPAGAEWIFCPVREELKNFVPGDIESMQVSAWEKMYLSVHTGRIDIDRILRDSYVGFVTSDIGISGYRKLFDTFIAIPEGAILFHCSAGKDRTGLAAMLLLTALGVSREDIIRDYLSINSEPKVLRKEREAREDLASKGYTDQRAIDQTVQSMTVSREWIEGAIAAIEARFGSLDNYLRDAMGLTPERLQALRASCLE